MKPKRVQELMRQIANLSPMQAETVYNGIDPADQQKLEAMANEVGSRNAMPTTVKQFYDAMYNPEQSILESDGQVRSGIAALLMGITASCRIRGLNVIL